MKDVWEALADQTRREILTLLKSRPHTAGELCDQFDLSAATVSHHLKVLRESRLVGCEKRGQTIIYFIDGNTVKEVVSWLSAIDCGH